MLKNEDFAKLLGGGGGGGNSNQDKVRYDMKQIKKWEQENKTQSMKQQNKKQFLKEKFEKKEKRSDLENSEYRDRARERREDHGGEYEAQMEMVSQLSAEQTQYLGGDLEHTHLVKGLDYSLLKKVRSEVETQEIAKTLVVVLETPSDELLSSTPISSVSVATPTSSSHVKEEHRIEELTTRTHLGFQIKNLLLSSSGPLVPPPPLKKDSILLSHRSLSTIARSAYEFDIDPLSMNDLPTTLMRSKDDLVFHNGYDTDQLCAPFALSASLFSRLQEVFHRGDVGIKERKEKKLKEQKSLSAPLPLLPPTPAPVLSRIEPINMFDDDVGTYEPTFRPPYPPPLSGPSTTSTPVITAENSSKKYFSVASTSSLFSSSRSTDKSNEGGAKSSSSSGEPVDLLAPVKQLVAGQMIKQSILTNQRAGEMVIEAGKTHRDIFGGLETNDDSERRRKSNGYSMIASRLGRAGEDGGDGEYEVMDNEMDESDEEEGAGKKKKKKTISGQGGGGGARAGGASSGGGGGSQADGGLNRAARRALARGEGGSGDAKRSRLG
jgi:hypothetical protein